LHSCKPPILHRDLKTLNIFLDANLRIKIGDFGWTKPLGPPYRNIIGSKVATEVLKGFRPPIPPKCP